MDSNLDLPSTDAKAALSKPPARNRNYGRRPAVSGSSESDWSHEHNDNSSPKVSMDGTGKVSEHQPRRKDDDRDIKKDSERSYSGRSYDSFRHSDRQSRNSKDYHRDADYNKADKHANDEEGNHQKLSSRSSRGSRGGAQYDHVRSRESSRYLDKHSREKYDGSGHGSKDKDRISKFLENQRYKDDSSSEKIGSAGRHGHFEEVERVRDGHTVGRDSQVERKDYRSRDYRSERNLSYEESRRHRSDSKHEGCKSDFKEMDHENFARDQRKKYDDTDTRRRKDQIIKEPTEGLKSEDIHSSQDHDSGAKRPKLHNLDKGIAGRRVSMFTTTPDGRESSSSNQVQDGTVTRGETETNHAEVSNDINAAKIAAMKAAELVNRNLAGVGPGCMTAEQKKKLLWGNKKNTTAEEAGHRWDTALFPDRERQEKFKKLMGVKGETKLDHHPDNQDEKQRELRQDLEKQYTAGLRRRDGRTVGLGL